MLERLHAHKQCIHDIRNWECIPNTLVSMTITCCCSAASLCKTVVVQSELLTAKDKQLNSINCCCFVGCAVVLHDAVASN
jgi:hypothetical protein